MIKPLTMVVPPTESQATTAPGAAAPSPSAEAAQQFEQIFLRKLLSSLMETTKLSGQKSVAGSGVYDSMVVDALAGTMSAKGGIGLSAIIQKRLDGHSSGAVPNATSLSTAAEAIAGVLPQNGEAPAARLDRVLKIHSSTDPSDRLFPTEARHLDPAAIRRTR